MNDQWLEPDIHEAEEYIDKKPAPDGDYTLNIQSAPRFKMSKAGTPYLEWFLTHTGGNTKFIPVFERTMLSGKGAFRHFQLLNALGYTNEEIKATFKYRAMAPLTQENAKQGVPCELMLKGEKFTPMGKTLRAKLKTETGEDGTDRNVVAQFKK